MKQAILVQNNKQMQLIKKLREQHNLITGLKVENQKLKTLYLDNTVAKSDITIAAIHNL